MIFTVKGHKLRLKTEVERLTKRTKPRGTNFETKLLEMETNSSITQQKTVLIITCHLAHITCWNNAMLL